MRTPVETLIAHVVETLPDSVSKRRLILSGLLGLCEQYRTPGHDHEEQRLREVRELLFHLDRHELAQRELALNLK